MWEAAPARAVATDMAASPADTLHRQEAMKTNRHGWQALTAIALLLMTCWMPGAAQAREGDSRTTLYVGTAAFNTTDATTFGTTFGVRYGLEIQDNLIWATGVSYTATSGERTVDDTTYDISANTSTLRSGLTYLFQLGPDSNLLPFAGGGVSLSSYTIDYEFPDSELGQTSGTAPGVYGLGGLEWRLGRNSTFIIEYVASVLVVEKETGGSAPLADSGFLLSLRLNVN